MAYQALGQAYLEQKRPHAAISALQRALQLDPRLRTARYDLGRAYQAQGRAGDAQREFESAKAP